MHISVLSFLVVVPIKWSLAPNNHLEIIDSKFPAPSSVGCIVVGVLLKGKGKLEKLMIGNW